MKIKKALVLSLIVNAIFLVAVGYMNATEIKLSNTAPIVVYLTNSPTASISGTVDEH
jgi:hypothetical protein